MNARQALARAVSWIRTVVKLHTGDQTEAPRPTTEQRRRPPIAVAPSEGRALFIDESGDSGECVHLTALSIHSSILERADAVLDEFYERFTTYFGLSADYELHGVDLVRKRGAPTDDDYLSLHRREFLYRDALEMCADIETLRIYSASWDWTPHPRKIAGHSGGPIFRERETYRHLFEWIAEDDEPVVAVTVDGLNNTTAKYSYAHYLKRERRGNEPRFLPDTPALVSSSENRMIQMADLLAYAGYHALQFKAAQTRREEAVANGEALSDADTRHHRWLTLLHDFYNQAVPHVAAGGGWHFAMRTFNGETRPERTHGP